MILIGVVKCPTKQLNKVITDKILKMDMQGCETIKKRIEYEKAVEQMISGISEGKLSS
jgi:hypothetical protein